MNGKFEPTDSTDQQCQHCGLWFDDRGIKAHEMHCRFEGRDVRVLPQENSGGDPPDDGTPPEPPDTLDGTHEGVSDSPPGANGPLDDSTERDDEPVATDGAGLGLSGPPERESSTSSSDPTRSSDGGLPDRFVPVDEYVAAVREQLTDEHADQIADELEQYDVVDVEATTKESIKAYHRGEVDE